MEGREGTQATGLVVRILGLGTRSFAGEWERTKCWKTINYATLIYDAMNHFTNDIPRGMQSDKASNFFRGHLKVKQNI